MARQASMSPAECETMLGARGNLSVNMDNRHLVRKWLVARGIPSNAVGALAMATLQAAYNDEDAFNRLLADTGNNTEDKPAEKSQDFTREQSAPAQESKPQDVAAAIETLRHILGSGAAIDENRVREILRAELPSLIPVTRIEIKTGDVVKNAGEAPRHYQLENLIRILSCGVPAALVGPAGSGKTTAVEQAATILGQKFYIQGAVQGAHELLGFVDAHGNYHSTPFREAFEHGGTICLDELDAGDPAGILVCNSALANCYMPFPDRQEPVKRHELFNTVANLNTFGNGADRLYVGRNQLDAATLDRFAFVAWNYDAHLEQAIACGETWAPKQRGATQDTFTPRQWIERVQSLRHGAEKEKARIVISPRASIYGVKLLAAGIGRADVEEFLIWKGTDAELRRRIETAAYR